jgi:hypothetical protein
MAIFDRKKEGKKRREVLPELPELPNLSDSGFDDVTMSQPYENPNQSNEIKDLPSFPDSDFGESLSQEAVKSAVQPPPKKLTMDFSENPEPLPPQNPPQQPLPPPVSHEPSITAPAQPKKVKEPVYIRLDKFKFAIDGFEGIKEKIAEVEKYLHKIREQKRREDEEMQEWEKEIESIKMRIEAIDNKIFSKL